MIAGVADTHAIVWYLDGDHQLSSRAKAFIEDAALNGDMVGVSSISLIETIYLVEKGRLPAESLARLIAALETDKSVFAEIPIDLSVAQALARIDRTQVPDMPDRIIAATARHANAPIISRDGRIRVAGLETIW